MTTKMDQVVLRATTRINLTNIMLSEKVKHKIGFAVWFCLYKFLKQANESIRNQDGGCLRCKGVAFGKWHSEHSWAAGDAVFLNLDAASIGMRSSLCETQTEPHSYDVYIFI